MMRFRSFLVVTMLIAPACAGQRYVMVPRPFVPVEPGYEHYEGTFEGVGGVKLFEQSWRPDGPTRGALVIVHGLKDHSSRYSELARDLVHHGFAVYAFDLRGHGSSEGDRVWINSFDEYLTDLGGYLSRVQAREPEKPIFLMGHSMGGAIATLYTLTRKPPIAGLILSGPALKPGAGVSNFLIGVTNALSTVTPRLAVMDLNVDLFSRDQRVREALHNDKLIDQGAGPARTAAELLKAMARIQPHMEDIAVPLLIMHGGADVITNPEGSRELARRTSSHDVTLAIYDGLYHDLLHEPEKAKVIREITGWLETRAPMPPPAAEDAPADASPVAAPAPVK